MSKARSERESRTPWFRRPTRVLQFNIEDRYGTSIEGLRGSDLVRLARKLHANVLVIFARDGWGRIFYRGGGIGPEHPKMVGDMIREAVEEGRRSGVKVVAMIAHTANRWLYRTHSEWAQVNARGETILLEHVPYFEEGYEPEWPQMCINSPFKDFIRREVEEALSLGVDGVFLDSFRYQPDYERSCYCRWCRGRFRREFGYEMPEKPDWRDSRWRELWDWRYKVVVERLKEVREVVKRRDPEALFMYNSHPGGWAGRTNRVVEEGREYLDAVFAECSEVDHQPPGFITEMTKLTKAMLGEGKTVWASRNYFHLYRTVVPTTPLNIRQGLRETIIAGGSPWALIFSNSYAQDRTALDAVEDVFKEHEAIEEYLEGAKSLKYAAIAVSNLTRDHYGRDRPEHYVDEVRGFYYALKHAHLPVDFIAGRDLSDLSILKPYKALALPNTACLRDDDVSTIGEWVKEGGGLLATYMASTCGESCIERFEFGLKDALGVRLKGLLKAPWTYVTTRGSGHPILDGVPQAPILVGDMSYDFSRERTAPNLGWHAMIEAEGEILATAALPASEWGFEYTLGRSPPAIGGLTSLPAITTHSIGNGRTAYFTWQLGRHYWRTGLPTYFKLIVNSVKFVAGEPPVAVEAPETVNVEYAVQGERLLIHLLNETYNQRILAIGTGRTKQPLPGYSTSCAVHPPREVVPVHRIKVSVKVSDPGRYRVIAPLKGGELRTRASGAYLVAEVPKLVEYELLVIEPKA